MRAASRIVLLSGLLALIACALSPQQAQAGYPYPIGYHPWFGFNIYGTESIPYFAKHPPVYYSFPVRRAYGFSPFAYPPGYPTPERIHVVPVIIPNRYVPQPPPSPEPAEADELPAPDPDRSVRVAPLRIKNPFFDEASTVVDAAVASLPAPKLTVVDPDAPADGD